MAKEGSTDKQDEVTRTKNERRVHRYVFSTTTDCVDDKRAIQIHVKRDPMYSLAVRRPDVLVHAGQIYTSKALAKI